MINLEKEDKINPSYYQLGGGTDVADFIRRAKLNFFRGNAIKYIARAGKKTESNYTPFQKEIEDLEKAIWYLKDEINALKEKQKENKE